MKLVKSSNQIPITAYACCKYHETTNYKVLQFLFNQSNCLITIKYSVQPIKLLNYHQTTPFNQSNGSITVHLCHNYHELPHSNCVQLSLVSLFFFYFLPLYKLFFTLRLYLRQVFLIRAARSRHFQNTNKGRLFLSYENLRNHPIKYLIPHEISEIIQSNALFHMKLVKSSH